MFYKVMKDEKVIDVLEHLVYLKYQPKHKIMVLCDINEAQAILASDNETIWHEKTLYRIPLEEHNYDTVEIQEIDITEYKRLKALNGRTPEEIFDDTILYLIETGIL